MIYVTVCMHAAYVPSLSLMLESSHNLKPCNSIRFLTDRSVEWDHAYVNVLQGMGCEVMNRSGRARDATRVDQGLDVLV